MNPLRHAFESLFVVRIFITTLATSAFAAAPLLAGCGSSIAADAACSDAAKAQCAKLDQCRHNGVADSYGTLGNCIVRIHDNCMNGLSATGTGNTPSAVESCATAYANYACQDYLQGNPSDVCKTKAGSLGGGAACAYSAQCQSAFCAVPKGSLCGTCKNSPAIGDPCVDTGCANNQVCTPMQTCQAYVAIGGTCDGKNAVCVPGAGCVIASGMTSGTCQADANTVGATCDYKRQTGPSCDPTLGLYCNNTNKCININYVKAGAACGVAAMSVSDAVCTGGANCYGSPGMCIALAVEGGACDLDTTVGPGCMSPDRCVVTGGGTSGTCTAPDPTMCM